MQLIINFLKGNFWVIFLIGITLGLIVPAYTSWVSGFTIPILMLILFITFLKINVKKTLNYIKELSFITYLTLVNLILVPILLYFLFSGVSSDLKIAILLISSLPAAASSPAIVHLLKGKLELETVLTITTSLLTPFTVTGLLFLLAKQNVAVDYIQMFLTLVMLILVPLVASQVAKPRLKVLMKVKPVFFDLTSVILLAALFMGAAAKNSNLITQNFSALAVDLVLIQIAFIGMLILTYALSFNRSKQEKIAICSSKVFMNILLGIAIATTYLSSQIAALVTLAIIPWNVTLILFELYLKRK